MGKSDADPLDALYAAPLEEFIATRGKIAAELKASGDKEGAAFIKGAVKPSVSAWAVNQAVRRAPKALEHLLEASDHLAETQLRATGTEARQRYQEAVAAHRQTIDALVDEAVAALAEVEQKASPDLRERIANDLRWAPQTQESRLLLRAGRLTRDLGPQDFGALARMAGGKGADDGGLAKVIPLGRPAAAPARAKPAGKPAAKAKDREKDREREARERRKQQLADLRAESRARHQESQQADKHHQKLSAEVEKLEARRGELEAELSETRQALEQARSDLRKSEGAVARVKLAEQKVADALAALEEAGDDGDAE
jgi:hypothetical protein